MLDDEFAYENLENKMIDSVVKIMDKYNVNRADIIDIIKDNIDEDIIR